MDNPQITHVSHCHGYGGIDLALARIFGRTFVTVAACEIEAYAVANSITKVEAGVFGYDFPVWTDIKSFPFGSFYGLVDIYSAGFPCQPFSAAGKGDADDDPRHLWPFIRAGISQMRPEFVFLENVEGIISSKLKGTGWRDPAGTPVLLHVLRELERLGYVPEAGIFSALEKGASMQRKRTFILARLANGNRERQSQLRRIIFESRGWVGDGGSAMANPASTGRPAISGGISSYAGPEDRRSPVNDHQFNCGSEGVADPDLQKPPLIGRSGAGQGAGSADGSTELAHPIDRGPQAGRGHSVGTIRDRRDEDDRPAAPQSSISVAHTSCAGRPEESGGASGDEGSDGGARRDGSQAHCDHVANRAGKSLAHVHGAGLEGRGVCGCGRANQWPIGSGGGEVPAYPPGPGLGSDSARREITKLFDRDPNAAWELYQAELRNTEQWIDILAVRPDLAPALSEAESALCGVADGDSHRVDRLRLCGNGVVPDTAEIAFLTLAQCLYETKHQTTF